MGSAFNETEFVFKILIDFSIFCSILKCICYSLVFSPGKASARQAEAPRRPAALVVAAAASEIESTQC